MSTAFLIVFILSAFGQLHLYIHVSGLDLLFVSNGTACDGDVEGAWRSYVNVALCYMDGYIADTSCKQLIKYGYSMVTAIFMHRTRYKPAVAYWALHVDFPTKLICMICCGTTHTSTKTCSTLYCAAWFFLLPG